MIKRTLEETTKSDTVPTDLLERLAVKGVTHQKSVPFWMMLVRSNMLLHSGCYGLPGNTRFHAQVRMRSGGVPPAGDSLGYM